LSGRGGDEVTVKREGNPGERAEGVDAEEGDRCGGSCGEEAVLKDWRKGGL
jgi:hypothetical protein